MSKQPRKSAADRFAQALEIMGRLFLGMVGVIALGLVVSILYEDASSRTSERRDILETNRYRAEGVDGQILNESVRNTGLLRLIQIGQQGTNRLLAVLAIVLIVSTGLLEWRVNRITKHNAALLDLQRRLLQIEEQTLELRHRVQKRPPPNAAMRNDAIDSR